MTKTSPFPGTSRRGPAVVALLAILLATAGVLSVAAPSASASGLGDVRDLEAAPDLLDTSEVDPPCEDGPTRDCSTDDTCPDGTVLVDDECLVYCPNDYEPVEDECYVIPPSCSPGFVLVDGLCWPYCAPHAPSTDNCVVCSPGRFQVCVRQSPVAHITLMR